MVIGHSDLVQLQSNATLGNNICLLKSILKAFKIFIGLKTFIVASCPCSNSTSLLAHKSAVGATEPGVDAEERARIK